MIEEIRKNLLVNVIVPGILTVAGILVGSAYLYMYVL